MFYIIRNKMLYLHYILINYICIKHKDEHVYLRECLLKKNKKFIKFTLNCILKYVNCLECSRRCILNLKEYKNKFVPIILTL